MVNLRQLFGRRHQVSGGATMTDLPHHPDHNISLDEYGEQRPKGEPVQEEEETRRHVSLKDRLINAWDALLQQDYKVSMPVLTPFTAVLLVWVIAAVLLSYGILIVVASSKVWSANVKYDSDGQLVFPVTKNISGPVYMYYRMDWVYQNEAEFIKSISTAQLKSGASNIPPTRYGGKCGLFDHIGDDDNVGALPCGLIAKSAFNDTFWVTVDRENGSSDIPKVYMGKELTNDATVETVNPVDMRDEAFLWKDANGVPYGVNDFWLLWLQPPTLCVPKDAETAFRRVIPKGREIRYGSGTGDFITVPDCSYGDTLHCNFTQECGVGDLDGFHEVKNPSGWGMESTVFRNWITTAATPTFLKLFARIDASFAAGDQIVVDVVDNWPAADFGGKKSIYMTTTNWQGGNNMVVGGFLILVGGAYFIWGLYLMLRQRWWPRTFGGVQYFSFQTQDKRKVA
ncbi:hypothetical protein FOL47_005718 [Perkinsus chesapeaki]|uniref:Uncharacterized protein n=1 Tax=Perkinsus chesapeaki TaxID=330153 RepID=A0A7J6LW45_PERCH|nr:hypothetical protein FOL47_005718 [Perkinsus chesapeaki]